MPRVGMMALCSVAISFAMVAGCDSSTGTNPTPTVTSPTRPVWLQGSWVHDDGTYTPTYLTLASDGTFDWNGTDDITGNWTSDGSTLSFDTYQSGVDFRFVTGCRVIALLGKDYYDRSNDTSDCPKKPDALSPLEQCAIGTFSYTNNIGAKYTYQLYADRTYAESYYYDGYETSGGYNVYGSFAIDDAGEVTVTYTNGSTANRMSVAGLAGASRSTSVAPDCDPTAWNALAHPSDPCSTTSANGLYCGAETQSGFSGGDPNTLYDCENGVTASTTSCSLGCTVEPPGTADHCA